MERKTFLSMEYGVKAGYAKLIRLGTHSVYGVADTKVYVSVRNAPRDIFSDPRVNEVKELGPGSYIITVPHYQGFTDVVPGLAKHGVVFTDIAGNNEILLTVIAPKSWQYNLKEGASLFSMEVLTNPSLKEVAIQAPVSSLSDMLNTLTEQGISIQHLYDY